MAPEPVPREKSARQRVGAVIVAAGQSSRMAGVDKTFAVVNGAPLIAHTLSRFQDSNLVDEVVLVVSPQNQDLGRDIVQRQGFSKVSQVCAGGLRRQDSVLRGLEALTPCGWVMVHDGARPCFDQPLLERGLAAAQDCGAAAAGVPVKDTIKLVGEGNVVAETPPREKLWAAQTPQIFEYALLMEAHRRCTGDFTDDAAMVEALGRPVTMFLGSYANLKVTTPEDLTIVASLLEAHPAGRNTA